MYRVSMSSNTSTEKNETLSFSGAVNDLALVVDKNKRQWHPSATVKVTKATQNATIKPQIDAIKAFGRGALDYIMKYAKENNAQSNWYDTYADFKKKGRGISASQHIDVALQAFILKTHGLIDGMEFGEAPSDTVAIDPFADVSFDDSSDDPLLAMMAEDAPQTDATVEADYIPHTRIMEIWRDGSARAQAVKTCFMAYMADANLNKDGVRNTFYNSGQRPKVGARVTKINSFVHKVLFMSWFNLAGVASVRGGDQASKNIMLKIPLKDENGEVLKDKDGKIIRMDSYNSLVLYSALYAIVAVEAGVKTFNHDLRKYISDDTIEAIREMTIDTTDLSHESATKNGWNLPYQRGTPQSGRMSLDDLLGSDFVL